MSKEYFSHDYNARSDPKLRKLLMREGIEGIGIYWCIIEMLYEQEGILPLSECEAIAFELHTECERIESVLHSDLFIIEDDSFYSQSVINRLEIRNGKSKSASNSANARWAKWRALHANALQMQSEGNAIKVNKSKEKEKNIIYSDFYDKEILKSNNDEYYITLVKFLFGDNDLKRPLTKLLNMNDQIDYEKFKKLREISIENNRKIKDVCLNLDNYTKKNYSSLYSTLRNWLKSKDYVR